MPLQNPRYEQFAQGLAEGKPAYQAYIDAGFAKVGAAQSASRLLKSQRAGIRERVAEILQERERIGAESTKLAIERTAITKERVAIELGRIGFANMMDYMRVGPSGDPVLDFSNLTREQAAALADGQGEDHERQGDPGLVSQRPAEARGIRPAEDCVPAADPGKVGDAPAGSAGTSFCCAFGTADICFC